jgi:hypothetical protein
LGVSYGCGGCGLGRCHNYHDDDDDDDDESSKTLTIVAKMVVEKNRIV